MADKNIIRQDVIQLDFETSAFKEIKKLNDEINDLKKKLTGGVGEDAIDDLKDSAEKAKKPFEKLKDEAEKVKQKLTDIGKKAAVTAFNGLKKLASISFKATIAGIGAAATAIGGLVAKSVSAYAEFEQLKGGVETLFGAKGAQSVEEYAKIMGKSVSEVEKDYKKLKGVESTVIGYANNAFKTAGLSANDYMNTVTSFSASLISSVGGDTQKAADLANMAITDMSDNANKMGTDMGSLQYAYQGFAKQNYTMLDNLKLGYGGTKTEMERLIKDAAKMKDVQKKLGIEVDATSMSYGNIVKAIHVMQEQMYINGTTQKEAEGTITGSLSMVKAAWGNLMPALIQGGDTFDQCVENLIYSVDKFAGNIMPAIEKALTGAGTLIEKLVPKIAEIFPDLAKKLIPPLIKAAVEVFKGLIKALPDIIKTVAVTIVDIFGEQFPIIKKIGDFFSQNAGGIANAIKKLIPVVIALAAAFKGFKAVKGITEMFGSLKGGKDGGSGESSGGIFGSITNTFKGLAKTKPTVILKGMANLAIILGGFTLLAAGIMAIAPYMAKLSDGKSLFEVISVIAVLGLVGMALAKFAQIAGKIPVSTVAKGLANMAIVIAGMSALFLLIGAVSLIKFDYTKITQIALIIGLLGTIGAALSVFAGIVGLIPVPVVALGLANMAIVIAGMSALFLLIGATSLLKFDLGRLTQIIKIITLLGTVGTVLSVFAGIVGIIPIPIVLAGLANMALVIGGMTALIVAFGKLSEVKGFNEFLTKGGETLAKIANIVGEVAGSLIGGLGEGIANSLPSIGENLGKFGENIKPLFDNIKGVDMSGVGAFFTSLVALLGVATGNEIVEGIKSFFGGGESSISKLGTELSNFATNAKGFFDTVATYPEGSFEKGKQLFECLANLNNLPKAGKDGTTNLSAIATDLGSFNTKAGGFFTAIQGYDLAKVNELWTTLGGADELTATAIRNIGIELDNLVTKMTELPQRMGDALKSNSKALSDGFVSIWTAALQASIAPINKLIDGANHLYTQVGASKRLVHWQPYAKGTDGHKGGNAIVNDGRGAELVQMPNGNTFIPKGRDVFLPNAPKGMKVLDASKTAQLFGKNSPTFNYANGIGNIDMRSYSNGVGTVTTPSQPVTMGYTPENSYTGGKANVTENNTYSPIFNLTINGSNNPRETERNVKRWVSEAMDEIFDSMARKNPRVREV